MSTTNTVVGPKVSSSQGVNSVSRPQNRQSHLQGHDSTSDNPNNPMCLPPYLFLNKKFLPMTPHSCQTLEEAMESEISAEYPGTTFVQPTVRHNEKGYFIGNLSNVELRKLHKTLNGKVLFGKFGQRATFTLIPRQKVYSASHDLILSVDYSRTPTPTQNLKSGTNTGKSAKQTQPHCNRLRRDNRCSPKPSLVPNLSTMTSALG